MLLLLSLAVDEVWGRTCSASQTKNTLNCASHFFESLGFYENDGKNGLKIMDKLAHSWEAFEKMCISVKEFRHCLDPDTIKNCITRKEDRTGGYINITPSAIFHTGDFICTHWRKAVKSAYNCISTRCTDFDLSSCYDLAKSISKCVEKSKNECEQFGDDSFVIQSVILARECQKISNCKFCGDSNVMEQIMNYQQLPAFDDNLLTTIFKNAQSNDDKTQLEALSNLQKLLSQPKFPTKTVIEIGFVPILSQFLTSKNAEIQFQAASALKYMIDFDANVIAENDDVIQSLIRALITTDEKVLEKVIELLATLIEKEPNLRSIYAELNIVESLLLSFTSEISRDMSHGIATIISYICETEKLESRILIETFLPLFAELIYDYNSTIIIELAVSLVNSALKKYENVDFRVNVLDSITKLFHHSDENVQNAAKLVSQYIMNFDAKELVQEGDIKKTDKTPTKSSKHVKESLKDSKERTNDKGKCSASQSNKMMMCGYELFDSTGMYDSKKQVNVQALASLATSWTKMETFCTNFDDFEECLGPSIIKNCINLEKKVKTKSQYTDFALGFIYAAGNYICGSGKEDIKNVYSCISTHCNIDDTTCDTSKKSINKCVAFSKTKCNIPKQTILEVLEPLLQIRECFKNPDCFFCDEGFGNQIKAFFPNGGSKNTQRLDKDRIDTAARVSEHMKNLKSNSDEL
uniref:Uncharacterized protein n=1 Tax=Panagrolaimus sp. ES5 TaxID=591445 RepID=A0AC34FJJ0_9BILA